MEVLGLLREEDDNPRGQGRGLFVSGATLEEVEAAEERRKLIQAERLSFAKQETGILKLVQSKNHFLRLGLPEPRWDSQGNPIWDCSERALTRVYDEAKKCCHPEWSFHPRRKQGFELLTEAFDTLSDRNGKRDEYVQKVVNEARERERLLEELQRGKLDGQVSTNSKSADDAAELREQMAAKTKRMLQEARALKKRPGAASVASSAAPSNAAASSVESSAPRRRYGAREANETDGLRLDDDDDVPAKKPHATARDQRNKKKRRVGVF